jgi:uncharacterized protein YgiM (DUF1202 family)
MIRLLSSILILVILSSCSSTDVQINNSEFILKTMVVKTLTSFAINTITPDTDTPTVTITSIPTKLPIAKVNSPQKSFVNIRSGPGINYPILFTLEHDQIVTLLGRNKDGTWIQLFTEKGDKGWILGSMLILDTTSTTLPLSLGIFPTYTSSPTLTKSPIPTKTPIPTATTAPTNPLTDQPPQGWWCNTNSMREVCVNMYYKQAIGYYYADNNSRYIVVTVEVKNISNSDIYVNPLHFTLVMSNRGEIPISSNTFSFSDYLNSITISPNNSTRGVIVFLASNKIPPYNIIYRSGMGESNIVIDVSGSPPY